MEKSFSVGYPDLEFESFISPRLVSKEVAVSGVWVSPDEYYVKIIYFETPHELAFTFQFKEDELIWDTDLNVSFGPTSLEQLNGKLY